MEMAISRWYFPVQDSYGCFLMCGRFYITLDGSIRALAVLDCSRLL